MLKNKKIVLGISGSIAAYKVYDLIRQLQKEGADIKCIVTNAGLEFVTPVTLEALLQAPIYTKLFDDYQERKAIHISLADWADAVVVVPASADIIAKIAGGLADDLLSSVLLATGGKIIIVPAMHTNMWNNPFTQSNVKKIHDHGIPFIGPEEGLLSNGNKGIGHIASLETILKQLNQLLK
jgi:phosphopantothenoylcysteine decarboxylase / phosphopantothenate---cysteine ligase